MPSRATGKPRRAAVTRLAAIIALRRDRRNRRREFTADVLDSPELPTRDEGTTADDDIVDITGRGGEHNGFKELCSGISSEARRVQPDRHKVGQCPGDNVPGVIAAKDGMTPFARNLQ